jgi:hypothetical protein
VSVTPRNRIRLLTGAAAAALVACLLAGLWALETLHRRDIRTLPDGSTLELAGVTHGTTHEVVHGNWWQKRLFPVVPANLRPRLGILASSHRSPNPDVVCFWIVRRGPRPSQPTLAEVFDEHGCEHRAYALRSMSWGGGPSRFARTPTLERWEFPALPRRGSVLGLRLLDQDRPGPPFPVAEFLVPNPLSQGWPEWTPEPLPISARDDDLECVLFDLATVERFPGRPSHPFEEGRWTRLGLRVLRNGKPAEGWTVTNITISDATGNRHAPLRRYVDSGREHVLYLAYALSADEPAWKLRVELGRGGRGSSPGSGQRRTVEFVAKPAPP